MCKEAMNPLSLIDEVDINAMKNALVKVKQMQAGLKSMLTENHDYGKIPGCGDKPTLLKPGAEKILTTLGITSTYELIEHTEDFDGLGFFAYTVKCTLIKGSQKITEGLGHANSKEKKWAYESVYEQDLPGGVDKNLLKKRQFSGKNGTYYKYEVQADANSKANTILKMAKKRAQIDAVLTVASLSEIFTQDFDDLPEVEEPTTKARVENLKEDIKKENTKDEAIYYCSICGAGITQKVNDYSIERFGKALCYNCQKEQ